MKACCVKRRGRGKEVASWLLPSGLLVLMPKCPACFAAYIAAATGLGLSVPAASGLRVTLVVLCMASLAFLVARLQLRKKHQSNKFWKPGKAPSNSVADLILLTPSTQDRLP